MKFKQILKKALKYVVTPFALVGSIIGLYSINSYAYTTNQFSYTCTYNTQYSSSSTHYYTFESTRLINHTLLINIDVSNLTIGNYQNNLTFGLSFVNITENDISNIVPNAIYNYNCNTRYSFNNVYTLLFNFTSYSYQNAFANGLNFYLSYNYTGTNYIVLDNSYILNIDFIDSSDICFNDYVNTYVENYREQLAQLQQQYDSLENNYDTLQGQYDTLEDNYNTLEDNYNTLESEYEQKQSEYDMLTNGQLGYLDYITFYIDNQSILFDDNDELDLQDLIDNNLYSDNKLYLRRFEDSDINPNYHALEVYMLFNDLPVNYFSMYLNGSTLGTLNIIYYFNNTQYSKLVSFDNSLNNGNSLLSYDDIFNGVGVDYIESCTLNFPNAEQFPYSINFNSLYNIAYSSGYDKGYATGNAYGISQSQSKIDNAREEGYENGYNVGKQDGIVIGSDDNNTLYGVVIRTL